MTHLQNIITFGHELIKERLQIGDIVVDATVGNGHDTVFLAKLVGNSGHVYGFDIQESAIERTRKRLTAENVVNQVTLFNQSHHLIGQCLDGKRIKAAIFNLGYLPGGDKTIVTVPDKTIQAVDYLVHHMESNGIIIVTVYPGHPEGKIESQAFYNYVQELDQKYFNVLKYAFLNRQNSPPYLIAIEIK